MDQIDNEEVINFEMSVEEESEKLQKATADSMCCACLQNEDITLAKDSVKAQFREVFKLEIQIEGCETHICQICVAKLNTAQEFYNQIQLSQNYLRNIKNDDKILIEDKNIQTPPLENIEEITSIEIDEEEEDNQPLIKSKNRLRENAEKMPKRLRNIRVSAELVEADIEQFRREKYSSRDFKCTICDFRGVSRRNIAMHMKGTHNLSEKENNYCSNCNQTVDNFLEHRRTHKYYWSCKFCRKMIKNNDYILHLRKHSDNNLISPICKKVYPESERFEFEIHKKGHPNDKPLCPVCEKEFKTEKTLQEHIATHSRYTCNDCGKNFEIPELLISHICVPKDSDASDESEFYGSKENIDQVVLKQESLKADDDSNCENPDGETLNFNQFLTSETDGQKEEGVRNRLDLTCEICQKSYKNKYYLQAHIKGHMDVFKHRCSFCNKGYTNRADLIIHENSRHSDTKSYICSTCGKGYSTKGSLTTHMKTHGGRNEVCDICQKTFCRKIDLKLHLQKHKGERPHLCPDCGKSFAQKSHLVSHLTSHSEERPYGCHLCDKRFKKKELLKHHIRLHGDKPLKCPQCPYECHKPYRLQCHMKMHQGTVEEKTTLCKLCDKGFRNTRLLQNHMEAVHKVIVGNLYTTNSETI